MLVQELETFTSLKSCFRTLRTFYRYLFDTHMGKCNVVGMVLLNQQKVSDTVDLSILLTEL